MLGLAEKRRSERRSTRQTGKGDESGNKKEQKGTRYKKARGGEKGRRERRGRGNGGKGKRTVTEGSTIGAIAKKGCENDKRESKSDPLGKTGLSLG
jgi:hypothetical protein